MQDHKIKHEPSINFWRFATGCSSSGTYLITGASRSRCFGYGKKVQARAAETKGLFFKLGNLTPRCGIEEHAAHGHIFGKA